MEPKSSKFAKKYAWVDQNEAQIYEQFDKNEALGASGGLRGARRLQDPKKWSVSYTCFALVVSRVPLGGTFGSPVRPRGNLKILILSIEST